MKRSEAETIYVIARKHKEQNGQVTHSAPLHCLRQNICGAWLGRKRFVNGNDAWKQTTKVCLLKVKATRSLQTATERYHNGMMNMAHNDLKLSDSLATQKSQPCTATLQQLEVSKPECVVLKPCTRCFLQGTNHILQTGLAHC